MAEAKVLILEAPWSGDIEDTQATRDIYMSAGTLLGIGAKPVQLIHRPLIEATYIDDIERFVELGCNQRGPNVIVFSAHGQFERRKRKKKIRLSVTGYDGEFFLSGRDGIGRLQEKLARSIIVLDSCGLGQGLKKFREKSGALGVVGFAGDVDWVDSSVFVLAMLFKLHENGVLSLKRAQRSGDGRKSRAESVIETMVKREYASLAESLEVRTEF